jgi:hypothetical protein
MGGDHPVHDWLDMACRVFLGGKGAYKRYKSKRNREQKKKAKKAAQREATMAVSRSQSPVGGHSPVRSVLSSLPVFDGKAQPTWIGSPRS